MSRTFALALAAFALLVAGHAAAVERGLAVGDGWIAVTDREFDVVVVIDTAKQAIAARLDVNDGGSVMHDASVEAAAGGNTPIKLLSAMDPGTEITAAGSAQTNFVTVLGGLPYAKPSDVRWVIERPGSLPSGQWDRIVSLEPAVYYDSKGTRLAIEREIVEIDTNTVRTGNGEATPNVIADLERRRVFVPTWRAGRAGVAMVDIDTAQLLEFQLSNRHFGNHGVIGPKGELLYVVSEGIWVVDLLSRRVLGDMKLPYMVGAVAMSNDGAELYLLDAEGRMFEARDARTLRRLWHAVVNLEQ